MDGEEASFDLNQKADNFSLSIFDDEDARRWLNEAGSFHSPLSAESTNLSSENGGLEFWQEWMVESSKYEEGQFTQAPSPQANLQFAKKEIGCKEPNSRKRKRHRKPKESSKRDCPHCSALAISFRHMKAIHNYTQEDWKFFKQLGQIKQY